MVQRVLPELGAGHRRRDVHEAQAVGDDVVLAVEDRLVVEAIQEVVPEFMAVPVVGLVVAARECVGVAPGDVRDVAEILRIDSPAELVAVHAQEDHDFCVHRNMRQIPLENLRHPAVPIGKVPLVHPRPVVERAVLFDVVNQPIAGRADFVEALVARAVKGVEPGDVAGVDLLEILPVDRQRLLRLSRFVVHRFVREADAQQRRLVLQGRRDHWHHRPIASLAAG